LDFILTFDALRAAMLFTNTGFYRKNSQNRTFTLSHYHSARYTC